MKIDPSKIYLMPLVIGPICDRENLVARAVYGEVEYLSLQYQTDPDAILGSCRTVTSQLRGPS